MQVYLIAPEPNFGRDPLILDKILQVKGRYTLMAAAGITTVAAFFDDDFSLRLCDEQIEDVDFDDPSEVICISMNVAQAARGIEIAKRFRAAGRTVVLGGAHVSLAPEVFDGVADCLVIGEFEPVADEFIADLRGRRLKPRYQGAKADLARTPLPRWDLYPNDRAVSGVIQTSRGCPFECNFCDVIQYFGRTQRHKPVEQVIAEAQRLYDHGYRSINLSDDNFTVYRKRTHALLDALAAWNGREGREPVQFITQASIDLARDDDLMEMCVRAGVRDIFFGIESSDEEALKASKKRQNLNHDLVQLTQKLTRAGIMVTSGMIVGFDSDDLTCFERQFNFGMSLPAVNIRVTVLVAPAATPLYAEMKAAGRLVEDHGVSLPGRDLWTNIEPKNMTRGQLAEGAIWLVDALLKPENVIRRFEHMASLLRPPPEHLRRPTRKRMGATGASAILQLMKEGAKDPRARQVMEAVNDLSRARPEISWDLASALAGHLNVLSSSQHLAVDRSRTALYALGQ